MTESDTLHTRCRDEIDRRLRAATDASSKLTGWINWPGGSQRQIGLCFDDQDDPAAIVYLARPQADALLAVLESGNPAAVIAWLEGELQVLERHKPSPRTTDPLRREVDPWDLSDCAACDEHVPCPEIRSLAHRLGVSVE